MVALAHATERQEAAGSAAVIACLWIVTGDARPRQSAVRRQVGLYGGEMLEPSGMPGGASEGLLAATRLAREHGAARVIWPVHAGVPLDPESLDVERAAGIVERSLLTERLAAIDDPDGVVIETPLADLRDAQVAELAVDQAVPLQHAWWWGSRGEAAEASRERWERAWQAIGCPLPDVDTSTNAGRVDLPGRSLRRG